MTMTDTILKDKNVLIAGGSSGMGLAIAKSVLAEGAIVHLVSTNITKLEAAKAALGSTNVFIYAVDISNEEAVTALAAKISTLDHLVTTAARLTFKPLLQLTKAEIDQMVHSKFWGPVLLTQKFANKINKDGSIIYYSGVAADKGSAGAAIVGALNSALHGLAKNLVYEISPIRVNVVSPGVVATPTWNFMSEDNQKGFYDDVANSLPVKRVGMAEDLAQTALYLMKNKYTNGTVITIDGGSNA